MIKHNSGKKAFLSVVLTLFLCTTLLIGNTFAWFTDSASTGVNSITSGNLDIGLYYGTVENETISYNEVVNDKSLLFNQNALWEPGYTEVAYLKIANLGSLAFKAFLSVNFTNEKAGTSVEGNEILLSDYLMYDIIEIEEGAYYATRDEALTAASADAKLIATEENEIKMVAGAAPKYYAIVVYMPETVGNEANYRGTDIPSIDLSVSLKATQDTVENDSWDNQYDSGAGFSAPVSSPEDLNSALADESKKDIVVSGGIYNTPIKIPENKNVTFESAEVNTVANYGIAVSAGKNSNIILNGGKYTAFEYAQVFDAQEEGSNIVINGGTFEGNFLACVDKDAKVTVNGGVFDTPTYPGTVLVMSTSDNSSAVVTITDGTFYSDAICDNFVSVKIEGGTFYLKGISNYPNMITKEQITISGGSFNVDPTEYLADGYIATQNGNMWVVSAN